jgi:PAS domain S-box-containing protein
MGLSTEVERQRQVAESLRALLLVVNSARSLEEVLDEVLNQACRVLSSDAAALYLRTDERLLTLRAARGLQVQELARHLRVGSPVTGLAVLRKAPVTCIDVQKSLDDELKRLDETVLVERGGWLEVVRMGPALDPDLDAPRGAPRVRLLASRFRAVLAVPLLMHEQVNGAIVLYCSEPYDFSAADVELGRAFADQAAVAIENIRWHEQAELRARDLEARNRVFRALHDIAVAVGGVLEPRDLARLVAKRACELLSSDGVALYVLDESTGLLTPLHSSDDDMHSPEPPLAIGEGAAGQAFLRGEAVSISDYASWPHAGTWATDHAVAASLAVPLRVDDRSIGAISVRMYSPRCWTTDDAQTLGLLAAQVAPGLEAARLYHRTRDEARDRAVLLALEQLSRERLEVALDSGRMGTWEWEVRTDSVNWSPQLEAIHGFDVGTFGSNMRAYLDHVHPDDVERVRGEIAASLERGVLNLEYRAIRPDGAIHWFEARGRLARDESGEPLCMRGVCMDVTERKQAEAERAALLERERAVLEANAALEERQKLARELHDSVSQALYGITLGARTALDALARDQDTHAADEATRYILDLADAGLAELRALIFELRPESLQQQGLVVALERFAASARARHKLHVITQLGQEPNLTLATREALYRIAREAVHNTIKHARAHSVRITMESVASGVLLEIADDGVGFDPDGEYPGHLGLTSIRERARGIGAEVNIRSAPGQGTTVRVRVPSP